MADNDIVLMETLLTKLSLSKVETQIYLSLYQKSPSTVLDISKNTGLARTSTYRHLEKMIERGLIEEILLENTKVYKPGKPQILDSLVYKKKEDVQIMEELLPQVKDSLYSENNKPPDTQVRFYKSKNGIEHLIWNSLNSKEIVGYTFKTFEDMIGEEAALTIREEMYSKKIKCRDIISADDPYLNPTDIESYRNSKLHTYYDWRYIDPTKVKIDHQIAIYDNRVSFIRWYGTEIFGIEITSPTIAKMQKQIFELLWEQSATPEKMLKTKDLK
jgi:sugar-specific transcriptional regulator TrmB